MAKPAQNPLGKNLLVQEFPIEEFLETIEKRAADLRRSEFIASLFEYEKYPLEEKIN